MPQSLREQNNLKLKLKRILQFKINNQENAAIQNYQLRECYNSRPNRVSLFSSSVVWLKSNVDFKGWIN